MDNQWIDAANQNGAYEVSWKFAGTTFRNADIRCITNQPPLSSIIKSRRLTFFGHLAQMDENADATASQAIFEPPPENWRQPPGRPRTTWLKNILDDLSSLDLGSRPGVKPATSGAANPTPQPLCHVNRHFKQMETFLEICLCAISDSQHHSFLL